MFSEITMIDYARPLPARREARRFCGPYKWTPSAPGRGRGFYMSDRDGACDEAGSTFRLRLEFAPADRRGVLRYATTADGTEFIPIVARLPRGRGFLAGWSMGAGMAASLEPERYDDEEEAYRAAHDEAARAAEREADYQAEYAEEDDDVF